MTDCADMMDAFKSILSPTNRCEVLEGKSRFEVVVTHTETGEEVVRAKCRGGVIALSKSPEDIDPTYGKDGRAIGFGANNRILQAMTAFEIWIPLAKLRLKILDSGPDPDKK